MYQSSTRKNFLDILADPTAIAILASIALHAGIGASFPFFTQPEKEGKKVGPTTVKVVELTPSELQRIPQVPQTPAPQASTPVPQPATPTTQSVTPPTTQFSTTPQTIPFSPIRISGETTKPSKDNKAQKVTPQKSPPQSIFDPNNIFKPTPKPTKTLSPKGVTPKPTPQTSPSPKTPPATKKPPSSTASTSQQTTPTDDDGGEQPTPTQTTAPTTGQPQQPGGTKTPTTGSPTVIPATQPAGDPTGNSSGNGFYGKYTDAALKQLTQYMTEYDVKEPYPSKTITRSYPEGTVCTKEKQAPFIVMMAVFDKVPDDRDAAILGTSSAPAVKISTFKDRDTPEQQKLGEIATRTALEEASKADQNRPEKDKGKRVIYQYRVQFDPATCK
jgi:hypothetical protein